MVNMIEAWKLLRIWYSHTVAILHALYIMRNASLHGTKHCR
jgi:hypothetical protein